MTPPPCHIYSSSEYYILQIKDIQALCVRDGTHQAQSSTRQSFSQKTISHCCSDGWSQNSDGWSQNSPNQKIKAGWMSVMRRTTVIRSTVPARECLFSDGIVLVSGSIRAADIKRLHWTWTTFGLLSLNLALIWDKPGIKITFSTPLICLWLCFHHYSNKLMYRSTTFLPRAVSLNTIYFKTLSFLHLCGEVFEYSCIVFGLW